MTQQTVTSSVHRTHADLLVWAVLVLICAPELIIQAADAGWIGSALWRPLSVQYGAFWPGLLRDWQPNYAGQPWAMFLSYSVLHIGPGHMAGNALVLWWLGPQVIDHVGARGFAVVWAASAVIGGATFGLLAPGPVPMVGASGCVFGLLGVVITHRYLLTGRIWAAAGVVAGLALLHLITQVSQENGIAWQPHLGGFLTGTMLALAQTRSTGPRPTTGKN